MSSSLWVATVMAGLVIAGCGDDTSTGGAGATGSTTSATGSTTTTVTTTGSASGTTTSASGSGSTSGSGSSTSSGGEDCATLPTASACQQCCGTTYPEGSDTLLDQVADSCGCSGDGPCSAACSDEAYCEDGTSPLGQDCQNCILGLESSDACTAPAIEACQTDPQCVEALGCFGSCATLP